jgi:hypothetical protein
MPCTNGDNLMEITFVNEWGIWLTNSCFNDGKKMYAASDTNWKDGYLYLRYLKRKVLFARQYTLSLRKYTGYISGSIYRSSKVCNQNQLYLLRLHRI